MTAPDARAGADRLRRKPSAEGVKLETRLRAAAGLVPAGKRPVEWSYSFTAGLGCYTRVQIDEIDGKPIGGISIQLRHLSADAAEAVIRFLAQRNEPNNYAGFDND